MAQQAVDEADVDEQPYLERGALERLLGDEQPVDGLPAEVECERKERHAVRARADRGADEQDIAERPEEAVGSWIQALRVRGRVVEVCLLTPWC